MASILGLSSLNLTPSAPQARITSAEKLSVTPESQADSAVILSLNGESTSSTETDFESLIYNAASAKSGTANQSLSSSTSESEQIEKLISSYSTTS
jgi:hypothetical protein